MSWQPDARTAAVPVRREDVLVLASTLGLALLGLLVLSGVALPKLIVGVVLAAGAILAFFRPEVGLHALVLNALVGLAHMAALLRIGPLSVPIAFEAVILLAVLFRVIFRRGILFIAAPQHLLILVLTGWIVLSILANGRFEQANAEFLRNAFLVKMVFFFLLTNVLTSSESLKRLLVVLNAGNVGLLLVSYLVRHGYFGAEELSFSERILRTSGLVQNPNTLAFDLIMLLILCAASISYVRSPILKLVLAPIAVLDLMAILTTLSRSGFVTLCVVILFMFWKLKRSLKGLLLVAGLAALVAVLVPWGLQFRFEKVEQLKDVDRLQYATVGINTALHNPVFGVGPGNYLQDFRLYNNTALKEPTKTHNMYVNLAAEMGIPALILYVMVFTVTWARLGAMEAELKQRGLERSFLYQFGWAVQACFVNLAVFGLSGDIEFEYGVFIVLGLGMLLYREHQRRSAAPEMSAGTPA